MKRVARGARRFRLELLTGIVVAVFAIFILVLLAAPIAAAEWRP